MSVEDVLRRKIVAYEANGQMAAASNAREALRVGVNKLMASIPTHKEEPHGSGKRLRLRETPTAVERTLYDNASFGPGKAADILKRMATDPVFAADVHHRLRKPSGVSASRHCIAGRAAIKEPMLNGPASAIADGLAYKEPAHKDRIPKGRLYDSLIVKPKSMRNAKLEHHSAFWGERKWDIYTLRYARGFILVTDHSSESKVFNTYGELKSAIVKSGWEIVR